MDNIRREGLLGILNSQLSIQLCQAPNENLLKGRFLKSRARYLDIYNAHTISAYTLGRELLYAESLPRGIGRFARGDDKPIGGRIRYVVAENANGDKR